jgi:hypothetical protein
LIVSSREPEMIVFPSGEKATEGTALLCALSLLAFSSNVPAEDNRSERWQRSGSCKKAITCVPDFDRPRVSPRDDLRAIRRKGNAPNSEGASAVVRSLSLELESACGKGEDASEAKKWQLGKLKQPTCIPDFDRAG